MSNISVQNEFCSRVEVSELVLAISAILENVLNLGDTYENYIWQLLDENSVRGTDRLQLLDLIFQNIKDARLLVETLSTVSFPEHGFESAFIRNRVYLGSTREILGLSGFCGTKADGADNIDLF